MKSHVLSVIVDNSPGVLTRVCQLFNRRAYNLESVTAGITEDIKISRLTLITKVQEKDQLNQIVKQLRKLENVHEVSLLDNNNILCKEILFMKVKANDETRFQLMNIVNIFKAEIIDVATSEIVIQITGDEDKLKMFQELVEPFGIVEVVSSGYIAIQRGQAM